MSEVFLSYKAEDRARLKPLVGGARGRRLPCMVGRAYRRRRPTGANRSWSISTAARCVIVAWSERSVGHDGRLRSRRSHAGGAARSLCSRSASIRSSHRSGLASFRRSRSTDGRETARTRAIKRCWRWCAPGWRAMRRRRSPPRLAPTPHLAPRSDRWRRRRLAAVAGAGGWVLFRPRQGQGRDAHRGASVRQLVGRSGPSLFLRRHRRGISRRAVADRAGSHRPHLVGRGARA